MIEIAYIDKVRYAEKKYKYFEKMGNNIIKYSLNRC